MNEDSRCVNPCIIITAILLQYGELSFMQVYNKLIAYTLYLSKMYSGSEIHDEITNSDWLDVSYSRNVRRGEQYSTNMIRVTNDPSVLIIVECMFQQTIGEQKKGVSDPLVALLEESLLVVQGKLGLESLSRPT